MDPIQFKCLLSLSPECAKIKTVETRDKWWGVSCLKCREFKRNQKKEEKKEHQKQIRKERNKEIIKKVNTEKTKEELDYKKKQNHIKYYYKYRDKILTKAKEKTKSFSDENEEHKS